MRSGSTELPKSKTCSLLICLTALRLAHVMHGNGVLNARIVPEVLAAQGKRRPEDLARDHAAEQALRAVDQLPNVKPSSRQSRLRRPGNCGCCGNAPRLGYGSAGGWNDHIKGLRLRARRRWRRCDVSTAPAFGGCCSRARQAFYN